MEFTKMTAEELLLSTEKAIGNGSLHDMHMKLITGGKDLAALEDKQCATLSSFGCNMWDSWF